MAGKLIDALQQALSIRVEDLSFKDTMYDDEAFFDRSIQNNFTGWYWEEDLLRHLAFLLQQCAITPPARVLDAACGHGRYSVLLSQKGYRVTGTDISEHLIAYLNQMYRGPGIIFEKRSFQKLEYADAFDLVLVLGNSLSLIAREAMPAALENLRHALANQGILFLEFDNRSYFVENAAGKCFWHYYGDRWLQFSRHYYDGNLRIEKTLDISLDLQEMAVTCYPVVKCLYNQEELSQFLRTAGFIPIRWFGNWEGQALSAAAPSLIIVAKKAN